MIGVAGVVGAGVIAAMLVWARTTSAVEPGRDRALVVVADAAIDTRAVVAVAVDANAIAAVADASVDANGIAVVAGAVLLLRSRPT